MSPAQIDISKINTLDLLILAKETGKRQNPFIKSHLVVDAGYLIEVVLSVCTSLKYIIDFFLGLIDNLLFCLFCLVDDSFATLFNLLKRFCLFLLNALHLLDLSINVHNAKHGKDDEDNGDHRRPNGNGIARVNAAATKIMMISEQTRHNQQ